MKEITISKVNEKIYEETLDNGLKVYIYKKKNFVKKCAFLQTRYGSINNNFIPIGEDKLKRYPLGIAHFLEHKLLESNNNENVFRTFEENGAYVNAATSYDKTYYYFSTVDNFEKCLETLIDFIQSPYFTDENVDKEKGIIGQEIDMRKDNPNLFLYEKLTFNSLKKTYYKDSIIGTKDTIDKITKDYLYECYNTFYNPSNMFLVIAGDIDVEKTLEFIKENQSKKQFPKLGEIVQEKIIEPAEVDIKYKEYIHNVNNKKMGYTYKMVFEGLSDLEKNKLKKYVNIYFKLLFGSISDFSDKLIKDNIVKSYFDYDYSFLEEENFIILFSFFCDINDDEELKKRLEDKLTNISDMKKDFELLKRSYLANYIEFFEGIDQVVGFIRSSYHNYGTVLNNEYELINSLNYKEFIETIGKFNFDNYSIVKLIPKQGDNDA